MFYKELFSSKNQLTIAIGFLIYAAVLFVNDGFMALDEYWVGIVRYIPAQTSSLMTLVGPDDVKSPLQLLPMHLLAQLALKLGILEPYWQYRFVLTFVGLIAFVVLVFSLIKLSKKLQLSLREEKTLLLFFFFYFAAPFTLTRPMFESIAAPWLTLAAVYGLAYDLEKKTSDLLKGVFFVSIAFVLRQQLGLCALVFVILTLWHKNYRHFFYASSFGLFLFVLAGVPDYFIRGRFHHSLLQLTVYNYQHGAEYGQQGVWYYPALMFVIFLIPFFILKYPTGFVSSQFKKYRVFVGFIFLFVLLHSLFPNKWERFLISIIPVSLIVLFPFFYYMYQQISKYRYRFYMLVGLNLFLFFVASFFPAQKNLIEMSRYLNQHTEVTQVYRVANTPEWITEAFILAKKFQFKDVQPLELETVNWQDCGNALVVGAAQADQLKTYTDKLKLQAAFSVNLIEELSFKLNPEKNLRRVQLKLYSGCEPSLF